MIFLLRLLQLKLIEYEPLEIAEFTRTVSQANEGELDAGLPAAVQAGVQAIITMDDQLINFLRTRIVELAMRHKLPLMGEVRPMTAAGGLMNYGPNQVDMWRRTAAYVDKILKGAKPGDLPIEQPTKFEFIINLKTA